MELTVSWNYRQNFTNSENKMGIQTQEAFRTPNRDDWRKTTPFFEESQ